MDILVIHLLAGHTRELHQLDFRCSRTRTQGEDFDIKVVGIRQASFLGELAPNREAATVRKANGLSIKSS